MPLEYTPSTSPVLGPLKGMSLRHPSRPASPVHLPSLRYPHSGSYGVRSGNHSPPYSPEYDSNQAAGAASLHELSNSLLLRNPHRGQSLRTVQRSQPYASRNSSRQASPDLASNLGVGNVSQVSGSRQSSGPSSLGGSASLPLTPSFGHPPQPGDLKSASDPGLHSSSSSGGKYHLFQGGSLPPLGEMHLPHFSSSSYFPASHSGASSQTGSRARTPPLSPDPEAIDHSFELAHPINSSYHSAVPPQHQSQSQAHGHGQATRPHRSPSHSHLSGFSMTPISFGQTYTGTHTSQPPSPAFDAK